MIIDEINESNFLEKRREGEIELQAKFDSWDRLKKLNLSDDEFEKKAAWLCRDPTIWTYGILKDPQNNSFKSYTFQDRLMNDKHRFVHITAANQVGKTIGAGVNKGLHHAIYTNNASVMIISSKEDQAKRVLDEMKWTMKKARIKFDPIIGEIENREELHLLSPDGVSTSVIRTFPPTTAILGYPATLIIMDETGFWEKISDLTPSEFYEQCVEPRTNATKNWKHPFLTMGQIVSITNPNGEQGLAYKLFNDERYHNYIYNWLAKPDNTLEEYLAAKKRLPTYRFASIYAATYMNPEGGFITLDQYKEFIKHDTPLILPDKGNLFLGGDFASEEAKSKNTDWTVLYGVIQLPREKTKVPRIRIVYMKEWPPHTKTSVVYQEIERLSKSINITKFAYDRIGIGDKVLNDLIDRGILSKNKIEPLTYSLPNKSDVYLNFQSLFEHGLIEGKEMPKFQQQLFGLKVTQPEGSIHIKIHHKTEGIKDDHPDALANACYAAKRLVGATPSIHPIKKSKEVSKEQKRYLLVCPACETEGKEGYYYGFNPKNKNLARINCPLHTIAS